QGKVGNPTLLYLHGDHLDTPRLATDASGQIAWQWQSDAFGRGEALSQGSTQVNLRFPGQYYDAESGLHYNYFRDYDPETGRYVESDPIGLKGGLNTYGYVYGNPLTYSDPKGLTPAAAGLCFVPGVGWVGCGAVAVGAGIGGLACYLTGTCQRFAEACSNVWNEVAGGDDAGGGEGNTNPYAGPVDEPVIVVDENGNAIPVEPGQSVNSSPNGDYQQVVGADGKPTGDRLDRGGHRNQSDPRAQGPHGHRPGVTTPDGNPHLPIY
ncbi:RHS repeat protein, partial [Pseudomonas aeruginosa]